MSNDAVNGSRTVHPNEQEASDAREEGDGPSERAVTPLATDAPRRPRARPAERPDGSTPSVFGATPEGVTMWAARRKTMAGTWDNLTHATPGALHAERDWPLSLLSLETLQAWWGAGLYEIQWIQPAPRGGRRVMLGGRQVEILPPSAPPPVVHQHYAPAAADPFDGHLRFYEMIERISTAKMDSVIGIARAMGGQQQQGMSFADLRELLREEREHSAAQIRAAVEPLQQQLAAVTAALGEEDDEDEETPPAASGAGAAVARAAGPRLFKGSAWWQQAGQFLTENPEIAKQVAPVVLGAVNNVTSAVASALATPKAPPPRPAARLVHSAPPPPSPPVEVTHRPPFRVHVEGVTNARNTEPPPAGEVAGEA